MTNIWGYRYAQPDLNILQYIYICEKTKHASPLIYKKCETEAYQTELWKILGRVHLCLKISQLFYYYCYNKGF